MAFLEAQLFAAREELRFGPNRTGWQHNETLRPQIEERVAFFEALIQNLKSKI